MNDFAEDKCFCYFHPKEFVVGVCAICLKERLLVLATKQARVTSKGTKKTRSVHCNKKPSVTLLPRIFDLGSILLHRLEFRHRKSDLSDHHDTSTSQEDSFISIRFEDNGVGSWDKGTSSKVLDHLGSSKSMDNSTNRLTKEPRVVKSVIEHAKPLPAMRWRKRIGHMIQLIRWKRSNKTNGSKVEGVKVSKGWIKVLTKRRTME